MRQALWRGLHATSVPDDFENIYGTFNRSSGSLLWGTENAITLTLTFGNGVWNAVFNNDEAPLGLGADYCSGTGCTAYGTVAQVPEPGAFGLFAAGLMADVPWLRHQAGDTSRQKSEGKRLLF